MIGVRANLCRIKENELREWAGWFADHKNELRQAEPHITASMALLWPAGAPKLGLDLLEMTPDICDAAWCFLHHVNELLSSQKAVHASCHCRLPCLNKLAGCDVRGTNAPQEDLEMIADPCMLV